MCSVDSEATGTCQKSLKIQSYIYRPLCLPCMLWLLQAFTGRFIHKQGNFTEILKMWARLFIQCSYLLYCMYFSTENMIIRDSVVHFLLNCFSYLVKHSYQYSLYRKKKKIHVLNEYQCTVSIITIHIKIQYAWHVAFTYSTALKLPYS